MNIIIDSLGKPTIIPDYTSYKYDKYHQTLTIICPQEEYDKEWEKIKDSNYEGLTRIGCIIDKITLDFVKKNIIFDFNSKYSTLDTVTTQCTTFKP